MALFVGIVAGALKDVRYIGQNMKRITISLIVLFVENLRVRPQDFVLNMRNQFIFVTGMSGVRANS
jgi:hypothetical protein